MTTSTDAARMEMLDEHRSAIDGVIQIVDALHELPDEIRYLKDRIVSNLLWVVTEFKPGTKHKIHGVRWRTPAAHALVASRDTKTVRHEHVIERRWMIDFLHSHPEVVADALWNYPACLVTVAEHTALGRSDGWGWSRYVDAHLEVIDGATEESIDLVRADRELRSHYASLGAEL